MAKILFVLAPKNYQDREYGVPARMLTEAGHAVTVASQAKGTLTGVLGGTAEATVALAEVRMTDYDAIVLAGGPGAAVYGKDAEMHRLLQEAKKEGKLIAAICIAPIVLGMAGVLEGKQATTWDSGDRKQIALLESKGVHYAALPVCVDGNVITANGPEVAEGFGKELEKYLAQRS